MASNVIKVLFAVVVIFCFNEPTKSEDECVVDACTCFDKFFFAVFKLVIPPLISQLSMDRMNDFEKFNDDEMFEISSDYLYDNGVENLIHLIADDKHPVEPDSPIDPDAPIDPNAPFDPNAPIDPNVPLDPNAPFDPNAPNLANEPNYASQSMRKTSKDLANACINEYADIGMKMFIYCRTLTRIKHPITIKDVQVSFEQEFQINFDLLHTPAQPYEPHNPGDPINTDSE